MGGATKFDKLCQLLFGADNNLGREVQAACCHCGTPLRAYYCEDRLYLVECRECGIKALAKAGNPQEAAYKTFAQGGRAWND